MKCVLGLALAIGCGLFPLSLSGAGNTEARLLLSAEISQPGETVMAAIEMRMAPRWHTYWRNAGESGTPTKIEWTLPTGVTAGETLWPVPEKYVSSGLTTYIYSGTVLLLVPLNLSSDLALGKAVITAKVSWLECEELCVPGSARLTGSVEVGPKSKLSADAELIQAWFDHCSRFAPPITTEQV